MATAAEILTDIYNSNDFAAMMRKVDVSEDLKDDIRQHVFCELFAKDSSFILDLQHRGKLRGYISSMVWSVSRMKRTNSFARQFGLLEVVTDEIPDVEDEKEIEIEVDLSSLYWYNAELLRLYAELGSYKAVSEKTGIPCTSIFEAIQTAKKHLKNDLK